MCVCLRMRMTKNATLYRGGHVARNAERVLSHDKNRRTLVRARPGNGVTIALRNVYEPFDAKCQRVLRRSLNSRNSWRLPSYRRFFRKCLHSLARTSACIYAKTTTNCIIIMPGSYIRMRLLRCWIRTLIIDYAAARCYV